MKHRAVEMGRGPRSPDARTHVGGIGSGIGRAQAARAVMVPSVCRDVQRARRVSGAFPRARAHGRAGEREARRHRRMMRPGRVVRRHGVRARLSPSRVTRCRVALLGRGAVRLQVLQRGDHRGDARARHVHRRRSVVHETRLVGTRVRSHA